jgi:AraC family transcriptional regulator, regulatory protein of adaptative response / methylated-DNA-[protein]-cysteine methyltransferase
MNMTTKARNSATATLDDPRWRAIVARDPKADGQFFYSVRTTGVYCRPSCAARAPRPENVRFHATATDAKRAGFRACRRCKPDAPSLAAQRTELVAQLCRLLETSEQEPTLSELAHHAQLSVFHLHRVFKAVTGLTPKAYAAAHRAKRMREQLVTAGTVTDAIYGAGYNSGGRFYAEADDVLGMTPTRYRAGGADTEIRFAIGQCSLGAILVARSERGVCAISIGDDPNALARDLQDRFPQAKLVGDDAQFDQWVARVVGLVEAPQLGLDLPLDVRGTAFQQRVWQALRTIPVGTTTSYSDIAHRIGAPGATRAVAQACAANELAVAIPCQPRGAQRRFALGLPMGRRAQARLAR